jgi:hypothetical protein
METYFRAAYAATRQAALCDVLVDWSWITDDPYNDDTLAMVHRNRDRRHRQAQKFNDMIFYLVCHFDEARKNYMGEPLKEESK